MRTKYHAEITDTDSYKLTMQQAICQKYPRIQSLYRWINRDNREFPDGFNKRLREILDSFREITLTKDEKDFLRERCKYLSPVYLDFLQGYRYDPTEVISSQNGPNLELTIQGFSYRTVLWEVPLMAAISELYFEMTEQKSYVESLRRTKNKQKALEFVTHGIGYSEFGTRRRYSYEIQNEVISDMKTFCPENMLGTSNPHFARLHNLMVAGTVAHEWYSLHAAIYGFKMANEMATKAWIDVYNGDLGTALPDTFTTDVFLRSFNTLFAKLHDGVRQDSGNPLEFLEKFIRHYKELRIDPRTKMILFSDNLKSIEQIFEIRKSCIGRVIDRYGIGTWLSNDVGVKPLNMVIKLVACLIHDSWVPTVKLSDDKSKNTGDTETIKLCKLDLGL
jgi:nicotinate phosphoribosyltransferase